VDTDSERGNGAVFFRHRFSKIAFSTAIPNLVVAATAETTACTLAGKKIGIRPRAGFTTHRTVE